MPNTSAILPFVLAICAVVVLSNMLVQVPFAYFGLEDTLTWGAFTYPIAFLILDLANRRHGLIVARRIVALGFVLAITSSLGFSMLPTLVRTGALDVGTIYDAFQTSLRVSAASGIAFLVAQMLDVHVFDRLRNLEVWWRAPLISSLIGSTVDTFIFFSLAFYGTTLPWERWAIADGMLKFLFALAMLVPYRSLQAWSTPSRDSNSEALS